MARTLETYESREVRLRRGAPGLVLDVLETRQPIRSNYLFEVVREKSPYLSTNDLQDVVQGLIREGRVTLDDQLRLVLAD